MFDKPLTHLLERWKQSFGQYAQQKAEAEAAAVRWEWTSGERYSPLPLYFQRFPGRGRVLKDGPPVTGDFTLYGFDVEGRVRLHRQYFYRESRPRAAHPDDRVEAPYSETFYRYADGQIERCEYSVAPHIPLCLEQLVLENGRVVFCARFRLNGYSPLMGEKGSDPDALYDWLGYNGRFKMAEAYEYEGDRLERIVAYYETPGAAPNTAHDQFTYDDAGKLQRIDRVYADGQSQVLYRKRPKGQTFQTLREITTETLVEAIVQRMRDARIQERIYCIELSYQAGSDHFPPCVIPIPERYRQGILQSGDPAELPKIFLPIFEKEWFYQLEDPQALEVCQVLEQEIQVGEKWTTATRILRDVAARLTRRDWSGVLDVTPDFVVFALDAELEGHQMGKVLSASASKQQIREWKARGLLR